MKKPPARAAVLRIGTIRDLRHRSTAFSRTFTRAFGKLPFGRASFDVEPSSRMGTSWGNAAALEVVDTRSPPSCAESQEKNIRRTRRADIAGDQPQEAWTREPGRPGDRGSLTARAFGWIDDAISASTIALRRRCSG